MDEYLIGTIIEHKKDGIIFENNNRGYYLKGIGLISLPLNQQLKLFVYYHHQQQQFFAFIDQITKQYFMNLTYVNYIGPKTALKILNSITIESLNSAIKNNDVKPLLSCQGITKKNALAIIAHFQKQKHCLTPNGPDKKWTLVFDALLKNGFSKEIINNYLLQVNWDQDLELIVGDAVKILPKEYY